MVRFGCADPQAVEHSAVETEFETWRREPPRSYGAQKETMQYLQQSTAQAAVDAVWLTLRQRAFFRIGVHRVWLPEAPAFRRTSDHKRNGVANPGQQSALLGYAFYRANMLPKPFRYLNVERRDSADACAAILKVSNWHEFLTAKSGAVTSGNRELWLHQPSWRSELASHLTYQCDFAATVDGDLSMSGRSVSVF